MNTSIMEKSLVNKITDSQVEIVRTVMLMVNLKSKEKNFYDYLFKVYKEKSCDNDIALTFALFNMMNFEKGESAIGKINTEKSLTIFNEIIQRDPRNWLVRMLKCRLLLAIPNSIRKDEEILENLKELICYQNNSDYEPYFIVPYILLAEFYYSFGKVNEAKLVIDQIEEIEKRPIRVLNDFLSTPIVVFQNKLLRSSEVEIAKKIGKLREQLYIV